MDIKPIRTRSDYSRALDEVQADWETVFAAGSPEGERYEVLLTLVEAYEAEHFPITDPDPIEAIKIRMEDKGLENRDLLPIFGTRARVYEVLNKLRGLSIEHIRELNKRLGIPAEILLKKYRLKAPSTATKRRKAKKHSKAA
jgi:HTH-type transcriptional regulator/antitoxin HigA